MQDRKDGGNMKNNKNTITVIYIFLGPRAFSTAVENVEQNFILRKNAFTLSSILPTLP